MPKMTDFGGFCIFWTVSGGQANFSISVFGAKTKKTGGGSKKGVPGAVFGGSPKNPDFHGEDPSGAKWLKMGFF